MSETKNIPLALQALDRQHGTNTVVAFEHAVDMAPHLGGLAVILDDKRGPGFHGSELGLAGSHVSLNPSTDYYKHAIRSGKTVPRMGEFSRFFRERGIAPSTNELITSALLHELGHADDLQGYIRRMGGDTAAAFRLAKDVRKSQIATLPLKMATSRAEAAWTSNEAGYKDKMRRRGVTDEKWPKLVAQNLEAYAALPCEKVADRFALGVLATMYS